MSPYSDRPFCNQSLLTCFLAPNIMENAFPISDHHIRNDLFEVWICFGLGASHEIMIFYIENGGEITIHISIKTLKASKLFKE